jgi:hypothetical protein
MWTDVECATWDHLDLDPVWLKVVNLVDTTQRDFRIGAMCAKYS